MKVQRRVTYTVAIAAVTLAIASGVTAMAATDHPTSLQARAAVKQRVAIEIRVVLATGKGTFTLTPLTPGPIKRDSGTLVGAGKPGKPYVTALGQQVTPITGTDSHRGKHGTFKLVQRVKGVNAARGWLCDTGTWVLTAGTGRYEGVTGRGAFTAVGPPGAVLNAREEGYLTTP